MRSVKRWLLQRVRGRLTRSRAGGLAVALLLVFSVVACAGDPQTGSADKVTLTYGLWDETQRPAMQQIVDAFEKQHLDIDVRIVVTPWDSYWTRLQTAATSGTAPDVFWMLNDRFKLYADGGALLQLDDRMSADGLNLDQYVASSAEGVRWDGHVYGLPKDTNSFGLFYNKKLFADAHVRPPDAGWTWQSVATAARKLTDRGAGVYGVAAPVNDVLGYYLTIPQAEGYVISPDGKKSGYADPKTVGGLKFWTDLIADGSSPTVQQMTDTDPLALFTAGKLAMYYGGSWDPVALAAVPYADKNVDVAPLPRGVNRSFYANGIANVAAAKTEHPDQTWEFLSFLGSKEAADIQARTGTVIPALKGSETAYVKALPQFQLQVLVDQLPNARPIPSSINTAAWEDFATREFTKAWAGQQSVEEAARRVSDHMDADLAKEPQR